MYDLIPVNSLRQGCSVRRWGGGWGGVLKIKWNKRQNRWFFWNKANPAQSPDAIPEQENKCLDPNLNGFKGGIGQQTLFFFWAAFGGHFQHSQSLFRIRLPWKISSEAGIFHLKTSFDRRSRLWKNLSWPCVVFQSRFSQIRIKIGWLYSDSAVIIFIRAGILCFTHGI